jgi:hypothetical protein
MHYYRIGWRDVGERWKDAGEDEWKRNSEE